MRIVLRSPNWIGDCVMSMPAVKALKKIFPDDELIIVTKEYLYTFFQGIDEIDKIITIPNESSIFNLGNIARQLNINNVEIGVLFTNSFISALLFKLAGVKKNHGYKRDCRGLLLNKGIKYPDNDKHHRTFYLDLINKVFDKNFKDISNCLINFSLEEQNIAKDKIINFGLNFNNKIIGLSTTAAYGSAKVWPADMFITLINRLHKSFPDLQFVLFGSKKEEKKISHIINSTKKCNVFNLAGKLSLRESMIGISLCNVFVSNDSGLMHIADALSVPLIAIFGPTIPHKTAPIGKNSEVLFEKVLCSPCKYRDCPTEHICMKRISVEMVFTSVLRKLNE